MRYQPPLALPSSSPEHVFDKPRRVHLVQQAQSFFPLAGHLDRAHRRDVGKNCRPARVEKKKEATQEHEHTRHPRRAGAWQEQTRGVPCHQQASTVPQEIDGEGDSTGISRGGSGGTLQTGKGQRA